MMSAGESLRRVEDFGWLGPGACPIANIPSISEMKMPGEVLAVLVSDDIEPSVAASEVRRLCGELIPFVALAAPSAAEDWIRTGAASFLPPGTDPQAVLAVLSGVGSLAGRAASLNPLTGLPGNQVIAEVLRHKVLQGAELAVYMDITGFKPFNDYYGFARGDAILRMLASILTGNLGHWFVGHIGGDDFLAVGSGDNFNNAINRVSRIFSARSKGFYSAADRSRGGIEALDRFGSFRFYPFMELTVSVVSGEGCGNLGKLAAMAGAEKKRARGEEPSLTVSTFLTEEGREPAINDLRRWVATTGADMLFSKALLESAGILGDAAMTVCLVEVLAEHTDQFVRKSAARALGMLPSLRTSGALTEAMSDSSRHVRATAAAAIPFAMGTEAGPLLEEALQDSSTWVRRSALRGLGISGWAGAGPLLNRFLFEGPPETRSALDRRKELEAALEGAAILGERDLIRSILPYLDHRGGVDPERAWEALLTLGGEECLDRMMLKLSKGDPGVYLRWLVRLQVEDLSEEPLREFEILLCEHLLGEGVDRRSLLTFLSRLPHTLPSSTRDILKQIILSDHDPLIVELALEVMVRRGDHPLGGEISRLLSRINERPGSLHISRKGLILLLRWASLRKSSVSRGFLEKLLRHESREIRTAAARAVTSMAAGGKKQV